MKGNMFSSLDARFKKLPHEGTILMDEYYSNTNID